MEESHGIGKGKSESMGGDLLEEGKGPEKFAIELLR